MPPRSAPSSADALVRQQADLVYRVALGVTQNPADAADAAQDALVKVWRHGAQIAPEGQRAWCARVARNAALDLLRRRRVRPQPADPALYAEPMSASPLPDAQAEASEFRAELGKALDTLGEPYKSLVLLREVEGLSYQEMADATDLPLNTLKVYLHRARRRLRDALRHAAPELVL